MDVELEPRPNGMMRVWFTFCEDEPAPEDIWIRPGLDTFPIAPKRREEEERDGHTYTVLQWGQCVIGNAMYSIEKHQALVRDIEELCADEIVASDLDRTAINAAISEVALAFHEEARIADDWTDRVRVEVDIARLRASMLERLAAATADA